ncbi:MAG TPA: MupA/Atu3671 family FMN-dependent luciferase-like monooxygenase [Thermoanaerobaculia bacterium]|nr:MupA/Atu3671 family FMN-dependent luciferase-like monooxygenase [Thermoanaerobaculia bacterium]
MADDLSKRLAGLTPEQRELLLRRLRKEGLGVPGEAPVPAAPAPSGHPLFTLDPGPEPEPSDRPVDFSLFFFSDGGAKSPAESYDLLLKSARFADRHGFAAVWTPERHFQHFGGFYPNPSILGAAFAAVTERLGLRAGSVVLPLHDPLRIAEEWAVVDRLSNGRAGVSFAPGWHPTDFALRPETYPDRRERMFQGIEEVRRLWRGEGRLEPRPVQPELPVWVTCSTNPATWARAGEIGAHVLTIVQPLPTLAERIARYRAARAERGFDPEAGRVTVMVHAFVGDDEEAVREKVRAPMTSYLRTYFDQYGFLAGGAGIPGTKGVRESDVDTLLSIAFEAYFSSLSLLGRPDKGARLVNRLRAIGADEVACLVDFGVDAPSILEALPALARLVAVSGEGRRHQAGQGGH